jgi:hypothetical protein
MSEIIVTAWAPTRAEAIQFLTACNIARAANEQEIARGIPAGTIVPIADVAIYPSRPGETLTVTKVPAVMDGNKVVTPAVVAPGWHFDLMFYDPPNRAGSATTLTKPTPEGGWPEGSTLFDKTYIRELVAQRTNTIPGWVDPTPDDPVPAGYAVNNVRAFDPATINRRAHGWV